MKYLMLINVLAGMLCVFCQSSVAQDQAGDKMTAESEAMVSSAKQALAGLQKHLAADNWNAVKEAMTDEGKSDFCGELAMFAVAMNDPEMSDGMPPEMFEEVSEIADIAEEYGIEFDFSNIQSQKEALTRALEALDDTGKRWEVVAEIWEAGRDVPFMPVPIKGAVASTIVDEGVVIFEMESEDDGDGHMQMMAPPSFIQFKNVDGTWKYHGLDMERTEEAMEEFMEEMGGFDGEHGMEGMEGMDLGPKHLDDPSFSGKTLDDESISLKDYAGKVVLVDFWGTWCSPCVAALPKLKIIHEELQSHGFEIIGIAVDEREDLKEFFDDNPLPWKNVVDAENELATKFGVQAFPTTLLIDKEGNHVSSNPRNSQLISELADRLELDDDVVTKLEERLAQARKRKPKKDSGTTDF